MFPIVTVVAPITIFVVVVCWAGMVFSILKMGANVSPDAQERDPRLRWSPLRVIFKPDLLNETGRRYRRLIIALFLVLIFVPLGLLALCALLVLP